MLPPGSRVRGPLFPVAGEHSTSVTAARGGQDGTGDRSLWAGRADETEPRHPSCRQTAVSFPPLQREGQLEHCRGERGRRPSWSCPADPVHPLGQLRLSPFRQRVVWPALRVIHMLGEEFVSHRDMAVTGKQPRTQIDMYEMTNARLRTHTRVRHPPRTQTSELRRQHVLHCLHVPGKGCTLSPSISPGPSDAAQEGRAGRGEGRAAPAPLPTGCEGAAFINTRPAGQPAGRHLVITL